VNKLQKQSYYFISLLIFLKILFIYLTENTSRQSGRQREREKQAPPLSREPHAGLDPRTPPDHGLS